MKSIAACAMVAGLVFPQSARAQTTAWLCISDQASGFANKSGSWTSGTFTAGSKYIIKESRQPGVAWEVREFGSTATAPDATCKQTFTPKRILNCEGFLTEYHFNAATGRFLRIYSAGYWTYIPGDKDFGADTGDTPAIQIGTCSGL